MTDRDDPPAEAVEVIADHLRSGLGLMSGDAEWCLGALRTLPAPARWRLISWLAEGLEPTRGMVEAARNRPEQDDNDYLRPATSFYGSIIIAALTAAREASDAG